MKINKVKRLLIVILCLSLIISLFSACSSNNKKIDFIYPFSADINSYDPQVASTADEFLIIENVFEGLIRVNDDGKIVGGVAKDWNISDDGLTYTFHLNKGMKWNIDTEPKSDGTRREDKRLDYMGYDFYPDITADDFVFALQRAAMPGTQCPLFSTIACIKNAVAVNSGKADADTLGVKAIDDYTLQITLAAADKSFMNTLATAVAMPCNRQFFNATKGRYGLSTQYTLFNGQFYVSQILETSYLLKNNKLYKGPSPAAASELTLKIDTEEKDSDVISKLESGYYDAAFISGRDTDSIKTKGVKYIPYNNTTWAFVFNTNNFVFQSETMRKAFCLGFTRLKDTGKDYMHNTGNLIPQACLIGANNAVDAIGKTISAENQDKSIELWKKGLNIIADNEISITILVPDSMQNYVKKMIQGIQSGIGSVIKNVNGEPIEFTLKIETVNEKDIGTAMKKREYDIAFYPFKSSSSSALAFLKSVSESGFTGLNTKKIDKEIAAAEKAANIGEISKYVKNAEKEIVNTYTIYPMLAESNYYASAKGVEGIQFHAGSGRISFVNATRDE